MRIQAKLALALLAAPAAPSTSAWSQVRRKYLAPRDQVVAIRAGRLFDSRSGTMLNNQVILIKGDRITMSEQHWRPSLGGARDRPARMRPSCPA